MGRPAPVFGQVQWSVDVVLGGQRKLYQSLRGKLLNIPGDQLNAKINSINNLKKATGIIAGTMYLMPPITFLATILSTAFLKKGAIDMKSRIPERLEKIDRIIAKIDAERMKDV